MAAAEVDIPAEMQAKIQADLNPREAFLQRRHNLRNMMDQVLSNINQMEDDVIRSMGYRDDLRVALAELAQAKEEIQRLRAQPLAEVNDAVVQGLRKEIEDLRAQLVNQGVLTDRIRDLTDQVAQMQREMQHSLNVLAEEQVRRGTEDLHAQLQEAARAAARKLSDVMPLVARMDSDWIDRETAEGFFSLANLGINDEIESEPMHRVSRVCVLLAKTAAPCDHLASFAKQVYSRLTRNPASSLQFISQLESVHERLKDKPNAQPTLRKLLRLADSEYLDDAMNLLLRFESPFLDAVLDLFTQETSARNEWRGVLLELPEDRPEMLQEVMERGFDAAALQLAQLTCSGSEELRGLSVRMTHFLQNPLIAKSAEDLLQQITEIAKTQRRDVQELVLQALRLMNENPTAEEVQRVSQLVSLVSSGGALSKAAYELLETLRVMRDEQKARTLALGVLNWLLGKPRTEARFVEWLLPLVRDSEENAETVGQLLSELGKLGGQLEQALPSMVGHLRVGKALALALQLCRAPNLIGVAASAADTPQTADCLIALLQTNSMEAATAALNCFTGLQRRQSKDTTRFIGEALAALLQPEPTPLLTLLKDLSKTLNIDSLPQKLILRVPGLWMQAKGDRCMAAFCVQLLKQLRHSELPGLLTALESYMDQPGASLSSMLTLAEICDKRSFTLGTLTQWTAALSRIQGADSLALVFRKVEANSQLNAAVVASFIETALFLCEGRETVGVSRSLDELLNKAESLQLLFNLTGLREVGLRSRVLDTARLNPEGLQACTELSALLVFFERDRLQPPDFLQSVQRKPQEVVKLVQACLPMLQDPAHRMTALSATLFEELETAPTADFLLWIPLMAVDLLAEVPPDRVDELGRLMTVSGRGEGKEARKLQENWVQVRDKLVQLLRGRDRLSLEALGQLYVQPPQLVHVTDSTLLFFNFQADIWEQTVNLQQQIKADDYSSWVVLWDGTVLCSGGGDDSSTYKEAYILGRDGSVLRRADMNVARGGHGIIALQQKQAVYVFGGVGSTYVGRTRYVVNSCEKFSPSRNSWTNLPDMQQGRYDFNPCLFHGFVYLSGYTGSGEQVMEVFSPETDQMMRDILIPLPEDDSCCVCVVDTELVLRSDNFLVRFTAVGSQGQLQQRTSTQVAKVNMWQNSQPVVDTTRKVFYFTRFGGVYKVDMMSDSELGSY